MDPILVAAALLVPSALVFLLGCTLAFYRTLRATPSARRGRQTLRQEPR